MITTLNSVNNVELAEIVFHLDDNSRACHRVFADSDTSQSHTMEDLNKVIIARLHDIGWTSDETSYISVQAWRNERPRIIMKERVMSINISVSIKVSDKFIEEW